jgi:enolase-phosphatase E1
MPFYLFDIEGTITDIHFVHEVLFPYARKALPNFIAQHAETVRDTLSQLDATVLAEGGTPPAGDADRLAVLLSWMDTDRKHPALKTLQGLIWQAGYQDGTLKGHLYPDVAPTLQRWHQAGVTLGIYSSGSVLAQKLLLGHSVSGDLTPLFTHFFDTSVGPKQEAKSYQAIATQSGFQPADITFFSDVPGELLAAKEAGLHPVQLLRGIEADGRFAAIHRLDEWQ